MGTGHAMNRRKAIRLGAGAAAFGAVAPLLSLPLLEGCQSPGGRRPNILFIFSDDHACQAIGAYGSRINQTPNIDRIAREGALFENSFCSNAICAPSRAVVLTGKFSHVNGKIDNGDPFDTSQPTFNKALQAAGYQTAMIGKCFAWPSGLAPLASLPQADGLGSASVDRQEVPTGREQALPCHPPTHTPHAGDVGQV